MFSQASRAKVHGEARPDASDVLYSAEKRGCESDDLPQFQHKAVCTYQAS